MTERATAIEKVQVGPRGAELVGVRSIATR